MSKDDQDVQYVRLQRELREIQSEIGAVRVDLRRTGQELVEIGRGLIQEPGLRMFDPGVIAEQVTNARTKVDRYLDLISEGHARKSEAEQFGPNYAPLEFTHDE